MSRFRLHAKSPPLLCLRYRAAHTLIEILLALGLSLVILAAVYAALDQHWRYADAGQRQTERNQVTRALFERITLDLRSVVFRPTTNRDLAAGAGDITRIAVERPDERYVGRSVGIVGDGQKLILQIDTPSSERPVGPQSVRWEMLAAPASEPSTLALARVAGDEATLETATAVSANEVLAEEVESIRFRYFARGSWFDRWDSVDRQELPQAVEVTIGFRQEKPAEPTTTGRTPAGPYRLVVPVPASEA